MSAPEFPELLTAKDVSRITGVPVSTLHLWAVQRESGQPVGPVCYKLGRNRRWSRTDVLDWLAQNRVA